MQLSLVLSDMNSLFQTNVGSRGRHDSVSAPHMVWLAGLRVRCTGIDRDREGERAKDVMLGEACVVDGAIELVLSFV